MVNQTLVDHDFHVLDRTFTPTSVASGAKTSLVPFGVKNLVQSFRRPGAFAVLKGDIVSMKLDQSVLQVLQAAYMLLGMEGSASNTTLRLSNGRQNRKYVFWDIEM